MNNINTLKLALDQIPDNKMPQDEKDLMLKESEILFEFDKYITDMHKISSQEAEQISQLYVESRLDKDNINSMDDYLAQIENLYADFAKEQGFYKPEEVGKSLRSIVDMLIKVREEED